MTTETNNWKWWKRNFMSFTNLILLILLLVKQAQWQQKVDDNIIVLISHMNSERVHMPLGEKLDMFITRNEFNAFTGSVKNTLKSIDDKLNILIRNEIDK